MFHDNEFEDIVDQSVPIIMHFKNKFDRRRPFVVDMNLNILPSSTNDTPSYPSGHSTQSRLIARYVAGKFPEHEAELIKKVSADLYTNTADKAPSRSERVTVQPNPTSADKDDTYTYTTTLEFFDDGKNYDEATGDDK